MKNVNELLIESSYDENVVIVKECLKLGADVLYRTNNNEYSHQTSLESVIRGGKTQIFKLLFDNLIEKFKNVDDENFKNKTYSDLVGLSSACDELEITKLIIENGVIPYEYDIRSIINRNQKNAVDILKLFIENGLNLKTYDVDKFSISTKLDLNMITFLVDNGLLIENISNNKLNQIILDCECNVFKFIADKIDLKNKNINDLLTSAIAFEKKDIFNYLISKGAKIKDNRLKEYVKIIFK